MRPERTVQEIEDAIDKASAQTEKGSTQWPGMTYEQGVENALRWVAGFSDDNPMDE